MLPVFNHRLHQAYTDPRNGERNDTISNLLSNRDSLWCHTDLVLDSERAESYSVSDCNVTT